MLIPFYCSSVRIFSLSICYVTYFPFVVCCAEMDLFAVVNLEVPRSVTIGVRPLGEGETPILQSTEGRVVDLVVPEAEGSPQVIVASPVQAVAPPVQQELGTGQDPVNVIQVDDSEEELVESPLVRKRARSEDVEESSKRLRFEAGEPSMSDAWTWRSLLKRHP